MASPPLTNREYAYFSVSGLGRHDVVSQRLDWEPSEAWSEGDTRPRGGVHSGMRWRLDSGLDDTQPLQRHLDSLLLTLALKAAAIRELSLDYDVSIQCVGYYPASGHGAHLSRDLIRQAATLGCSIDLDFYYVDNNGHDG